MAATSNPLTCKQCGYANEGERVYCHNCGTKLDRTLLPEPAQPEETLAKKQKRIRKIVMPSRGFFVNAGKTFAITMGSAIFVAILILIVLPPDGIPAEKDRTALSDTEIRRFDTELEDAIQSETTPMALPAISEAEINDYLQAKIKPAASSWLGGAASFERMFVNLDEDMIRITTQEKLFGLPLYNTVYYKLTMKDGKLEATVKGGNFGRLKIHPNLMRSMDSLYKNLWVALKNDKRSLDHCQSIDVHKDHVDIVTLPESK